MKHLHVYLAGNYFFLFLVFGITMPYFSPALLDLGFSKQEVGLLWGGMYICSTFAPMLGGRISDRWLSSDRTANLCGALMIVFACLMWWQTGATRLFLLCLFLFALVRAPAVSLLDTISMHSVGGDAKIYARIRMLGSIGFAVAVTAFGWFVELRGYEDFFPIVAVSCLLWFLVTLLLPRERKAAQTDARPMFWRTLSHRWWLWLFALVLHWIAFGPFNYGFNLLLEEQNVAPKFYGWFWNIGIGVEVGLFMVSGWFFSRWSHRTLLFCAFTASLIRWSILGWFPAPWLIAVSQLLHGPGFAIFYAAALQGIHHYCAGENRASYQGLFSTSMGLASMTGTWLAGALHQQMPFNEMIRWFLPIQVAAMVVLYFFPLKRRDGAAQPANL